MANPTNKYVTSIGLQQPSASDLTDGTTGTGAVVEAGSPVLTGTPTAPTAGAGTNTTQLATTAFVTAAVAGGTGSAFPGLVPQRMTYLSVNPTTTSFNSSNFTGVGDTTVNVNGNAGSGPGAKAMGATTNSTAIPFGWNTISTDGYTTSENLKMMCSTGINQTTNGRTWIGFSDQTPVTMSASDNPAGNYIMFRFSSSAGDTHWQAITKDNVTQTVVDTGISVNTAAVQFFTFIQSVANANILFYINGTLVATISTHIPSTSALLSWMSIIRAITSVGLAIAAHYVYIFSDQP